MTPAALADLVRSTAVALLTDRGLDVSVLPATVTVQRPRRGEHGDFATNLALQSAPELGVAARELAGWLAEALAATEPIAAAEIAGPGFVNLRLSPAARAGLLAEVLAAGPDWGRGATMRGVVVELVFAIADPVSPVPAAGARTLAGGDALGRLLAAQGAEVSRTYLVGGDGADVAAQDRFAESLIAATLGEPAPEGGYAGSYVTDIAAGVLRSEPSALSLPAGERHELFRRAGTELMLTEIRDAVAGFGVTVDRYASEPADAGAALVPERRAVHLFAGGRPVRVSERAGAVPSIEDLVAALGVDAARYALARAPGDADLELDLDLWSSRTPENPVFAVQYAHSRLSATIRGAADLGIGSDGARLPDAANETEPDGGTALFGHEREVALIGGLAEFPGVALAAALARQPHRIAHHLETVARDYHDFAEACPVLPRGDEEVTPVHEARTRLCVAARQVIASGLDLLGVGAPERL